MPGLETGYEWKKAPCRNASTLQRAGPLLMPKHRWKAENANAKSRGGRIGSNPSNEKEKKNTGCDAVNSSCSVFMSCYRQNPSSSALGGRVVLLARLFILARNELLDQFWRWPGMLLCCVSRGAIGRAQGSRSQVIASLQSQRGNGAGASKRVQPWGRGALVGVFQDLAVLPLHLKGSGRGAVVVLSRLSRRRRLAGACVRRSAGLVDGRVEAGKGSKMEDWHGLGRILCPGA